MLTSLRIGRWILSQNHGPFNSFGPVILVDCLEMTEEIVRSPPVQARCHRASQYRALSTEYVSRIIIQTESSFACPMAIDVDHSFRPLPISPPPLPLMIFQCLHSVHLGARLFGAVAIYGVCTSHSIYCLGIFGFRSKILPFAAVYNTF